MSLDDETEDRILENVAYIQEAVDILAEKQTLDEAAYLQVRQQRDIVEREFQTAIEACIVIATLLCKSSIPTYPNTTRRNLPCSRGKRS